MSKFGVLLAISSLPGNHGIGDFGSSGYLFVDWLKNSGYSYWQILPLNPVGPGNSPYMSMSSEAIDPRYISLDLLKKEGLINKVNKYKQKTSKVNYQDVLEYKNKYLLEAYNSFLKTNKTKSLEKFKRNNKWVISYATYLYLKRINQGKVWNEWPKEYIDFKIDETLYSKEMQYECNYYCFLQYIADLQYSNLKKYANKNGIKIIADCPFYVGIDSLDCYLNKSEFIFDENYKPTLVSGVPPDYFNENGQLWGTPIYDFEKMKLNNYSFLISRIYSLSKKCDYLRIDHFRAFDTYCCIPSEDENAKRGYWKEGPRNDFFDNLYEKYPKIKIIAEDLGDLFESVHILRDAYKLPGMYVTQFMIFDPNLHSNSTQIVYPGTHDNQTVESWFNDLNKRNKNYLKKIFKKDDVVDGFLTYTSKCKSKITIFSLQDLLRLNDKARMNKPGTIGSPNWEWKLKDFSFIDKIRFSPIKKK